MLANLIIGATYKVVELHPYDLHKGESYVKDIEGILFNKNGEYVELKRKNRILNSHLDYADGYPHLELVDTNGCIELSGFMCEVVNADHNVVNEQPKRSCGTCILRLGKVCYAYKLTCDALKGINHNDKIEGVFESLANCCLEYKKYQQSL